MASSLSPDSTCIWKPRCHLMSLEKMHRRKGSSLEIELAIRRFWVRAIHHTSPESDNSQDAGTPPIHNSQDAGTPHPQQPGYWDPSPENDSSQDAGTPQPRGNSLKRSSHTNTVTSCQSHSYPKWSRQRGQSSVPLSLEYKGQRFKPGCRF